MVVVEEAVTVAVEAGAAFTEVKAVEVATAGMVAFMAAKLVTVVEPVTAALMGFMAARKDAAGEKPEVPAPAAMTGAPADPATSMKRAADRARPPARAEDSTINYSVLKAPDTARQRMASTI